MPKLPCQLSVPTAHVIVKKTQSILLLPHDSLMIICFFIAPKVSKHIKEVPMAM